MKTAVSVTSNPSLWLSYASASLGLPQAKATAFLEQARVSAPDADSKAAVERVLDLIRGGETNVDVLKKSLTKK